MTRCIFHVDSDTVPAASQPGELHTLLYGGLPVHPGTVAIGGQLRNLYQRFGVQPSTQAVDLVSIALAVTAADTFVLRSDAANSWSRDIRASVPLSSPDEWSAVIPDLEELLSFLSGDRWRFEFRRGGVGTPPRRIIRRRKKWVDLSNVDGVSLFSGGLDSTISTISILQECNLPILVSHAYAGDAKVQNYIASRLPVKLEHVGINAWPTSSLKSDVSMRTRSFLFIALGILVCDAWSAYHRRLPPALFVPENGFIAINAPLTPRRVGALSTRTTHPHFLTRLSKVLESVGLPSQVRNPYELLTKGEMVASLVENRDFRALASSTVSCAKWKRRNIQCGRCLPCLVRRAALHAGNVEDDTRYASTNLHEVISSTEYRDDLIAVLTALRRLDTENLNRWVSRSGPLPFDAAYRSGLLDVFRRGLRELGAFLRDNGIVT